MSKLIRTFLGFIIVLFCVSACAQPQFQEGKQYKVIKDGSTVVQNQPGEVIIYEFFSYACPHCDTFEPYLKKWLETKPDGVTFVRVPVVYQKSWEPLARAFYVAQALDVEDKVSPAIFAAMHGKKRNLSSQESLKTIFVEQGVSAEDFDSAYNFSPGIDAQMVKGENLLMAFSVRSVPALVINGKYIVNNSMAGGYDKIFDVVEFLVTKIEGKKS